MLSLNCQCGELLGVPASFVNEAEACPGCGKTLRVVGGGSINEAAEIARLLIVGGPQRVGEQFFLVGDKPIDAGKLAEKQISLLGSMVSRNHCRFVRVPTGWAIEDLGSTNGIFVNDAQTKRTALCDRDLIRIGDYSLKLTSGHANSSQSEPDVDTLDDEDVLYDLAPLEDFGALEESGRIIPDAPAMAATVRSSAAAMPVPGRVARAPGSGPACPCCEQTLASNAKLCVECGIHVPSGRPISIARGLDEETLYDNTRSWLQMISFIMYIGLLPIASEALGTKKARSVWIIFALTGLFSAIFLIANWDEPRKVQYANYMLWCGSDRGEAKKLADVQKKIDVERKAIEKEINNRRFGKGKPMLDEDGQPITDEQLRKAAEELREAAALPPPGEYHSYQLLTNAFLHAGLMHFAGNMVFLLVFGLRVNQLLGDLKFSIVYPLLAICASLAYMGSTSDQPLHPALGASGAVMGLAGMYFVMFPVQRVYMAFWLRIHWRFPMWLKIFRMPGFWLLVLWVAFNDILPMALEHRDNVAHWAHIGGFLAGAGLAVLLLVSRQATARGGDLLSFVLGRAAWPLIGKPNAHLGAMIAGDPSKRIRLSAHY